MDSFTSTSGISKRLILHFEMPFSGWGGYMPTNALCPLRLHGISQAAIREVISKALSVFWLNAIRLHRHSTNARFSNVKYIIAVKTPERDPLWRGDARFGILRTRMANTISALKRVRTAERRTDVNRVRRTR